MLSLSTKGLGRIPFNEDSTPFVFMVGTQKYACHRYIADFLSPRIGDLHRSDPSLSEYIINTEDKFNLFKFFLTLAEGQSIEICPESIGFWSALCHELGNAEIYEKISESLDHDLSIENALSRVEFRISLDQDISSEIQFIASHFSDFPISSLKMLSLELLSGILSHSNLIVLSDDWLCAFVSELVDNDISFFSLYEQIRFEYLSTDSMSKFVEICGRNLDLISFPLWNHLSLRLLLPSPDSNVSELHRDGDVINFPFHWQAPLSGIIAHLDKGNGWKAVDGPIAVTSSECYTPAEYVIHRDHPECAFCSVNHPDQWICFDFKERRVKPTHYTLNFAKAGWYGDMDTWVLEGRETDTSNWTVLDRRKGVDHRTEIQTFEMDQSHAEFRYIRLRQTDWREDGNDNIILSSFELFGTLIERSGTA
jgi:hypothetical protein